MTDRSVEELFARMPSRSTLRRMVAVICALSFLLVNFAHTFQHFDVVSTAVSHELSVSVDNNSSDPASPENRSGLSVEHCHACSMIASISEANVVMIAETTSELVSTIGASLRSRTHLAENPPPIALT
ncbi:hypothetical protein [Afipia felis]|jgi:hypothetical protein